MDDNLVRDFILPKTGCCRYVGSDGLLNGKAVGFEDQEGGVLSLVISWTLWLVVNSMVAIRGFLIAELIALRIVRLVILSLRAVPFLSMTIVGSCLVETELGGYLF